MFVPELSDPLIMDNACFFFLFFLGMCRDVALPRDTGVSTFSDDRAPLILDDIWLLLEWVLADLPVNYISESLESNDSRIYGRFWFVLYFVDFFLRIFFLFDFFFGDLVLFGDFFWRGDLDLFTDAFAFGDSCSLGFDCCRSVAFLGLSAYFY